MGDIPYNLTTKNYGSYGDGLFGTIKMPTPSLFSDTNELPIQWGTTIGKIVGRAKGFGGSGTITRGGTVQIYFPTTFLHLPIVKIKLMAPESYDYFDRRNICTEARTGRSQIDYVGPFENREAVWQKVRIVHDAWERRDSPLQMAVFKNKFWLSHAYTYGTTPYVNAGQQYVWDARNEDLIYIWHAFGV